VNSLLGKILAEPPFSRIRLGINIGNTLAPAASSGNDSTKSAPIHKTQGLFFQIENPSTG
jgi:hypothetical protein